MSLSLQTTLARKPFRDWNYCTWLDGERLYALSRVLRDLELKPDYSKIDREVLIRAATRGKLTENYCYEMIRTGRPSCVRAKHTGSLRVDVTERCRAFWRWMAASGAEYVDSQTDVWSETDRVVWRRDLRVRINGRLTLIDIKCTAQPAKDWPIQIGCGLEYDEDGCERGGVLQLRPDMNKQGYKFREYNGPLVRAQYRRAVAKWRADRDFQRLKAELGFESESVGLEIEDELLEHL